MAVVKVRPMESESAADVAGQVGEAAMATAARTFDATASRITTGVATVTAGIEKTQEQVKQQMEKAFRTAEDLVSFGQGNLEAVMKSGQIWLAGVQDLSKQVASNAQAQVDATVSALRAFSTVRSPKEAWDLQTNFTRTSFEKAVAETRRLTDSSYKLAEQAAEPIVSRVSLAFEKFGRVAV